MGQLVDLPGVNRILSCQYVRSVEQALRVIQRRRAVTSAGSHGAINVWRDDARQLRSEFHRHRHTLSEAQHPDLESLRRWLETWWPKLEGR